MVSNTGRWGETHKSHFFVHVGPPRVVEHRGRGVGLRNPYVFFLVTKTTHVEHFTSGWQYGWLGGVKHGALNGETDKSQSLVHVGPPRVVE